MTGFIYKLTCVTTGKIYIGQTRYKSAMERWANHGHAARRGVRTHLANAIRKYGSGAFAVTVIERCPIDLLNDRERFYIAVYGAYGPAGYNMSPGGDGGQNSSTPEARSKISRAHRGRCRGPLSAETKTRIGLANLGRRRTPEQRKRIRESRSYGPLTVAHKKNISVGLRRVRTFKLSMKQAAQLRMGLSCASDMKLAKQFGVSRKMVWRMRHGLYDRVDEHIGGLMP